MDNRNFLESRAVGECKWLCRAKFVKSRELWSDKQQLVFHKGGL